MYYIPYSRARLSHILRSAFIATGLLLLVELSSTVIFNPHQLLGHGDITYRFLSLFFTFTHRVLLIILLLSEACLIFLVVYVIARPLALFTYLRHIRKAQEGSYKLYFPLTGLPIITANTSQQTTSGTSKQNQRQHISILDLVEQQDNHQLLLGAPGSGKTTVLRAYQYNTARNSWAIIRGQKKLPVYIEMNDYNLFLQDLSQYTSHQPDGGSKERILLEYLATRGPLLPGMHCILPYLDKLIDRGQILFLCDGINEVDNLALVSADLSSFMHQAPGNRFIMTCREVDYEEQIHLRHLAVTNSVDLLQINPLRSEQIEDFIHEYANKSNQEFRYTEEEILSMIDHSNLRAHCTNPMMLSILIQIIEDSDREYEQPVDTRGRLIHEFVSQLIRREQQKTGEIAQNEQDLRLLLSEVACAARWASERNAIYLPGSARVRAKRRVRYLELAETLKYWLYEHPARGPFALDPAHPPPALHEQFDEETLAQLIEFAVDAGLINISDSNKLSFRHEMIAEYFVAYYFWVMSYYEKPAAPLDEELFENVGRWSEPITIWAGLADKPSELAKRFAAFGNSHPAYALEAVTFSLHCMGVLWIPTNSQRYPLPSSVEGAIALAVQDADARKKLASLFDSCAQKGGKEIYFSLLPLLTVPGVKDLLVSLDKTAISEILFQHLQSIIDDSTYEDSYIKCLMRTLGRYGSISVGYGTQLLQAGIEISPRLQAAVITILGYTQDQNAIEPLIAHLSNEDERIYKVSIKALIRLGTEYVLPRAIQLLQDHMPTSDRSRVHQAALQILEGFLKTQLTPLQRERILQQLCSALSSQFSVAVQRQAKEIIKRQCSTLEGDESGKPVLKILIEHLSTGDTQMADNLVRILKDIGKAATPVLLGHIGKTPNVVSRYIIEVFEHTRDARALPHLLPLVADPALHLQIAHVLDIYAPESIPGLIQQILCSNNQLVVEKSVSILKNIRKGVVKYVLDSLFPIVPRRTILLIQLLEDLRDPRSIPSLISILDMPQLEAPLVLAVLQALSQYPDKRVIPPLLKFLSSSNASFAEEAVKGLSQIGELALDDLITALTTEKDAKTIHHIRTAIYCMQPFPGEQLFHYLLNIRNQEVRHNILNIFSMQKEEGARVLVRHLQYPGTPIRDEVYHTIKQMKHDALPALLEALKRTSSKEEVSYIAELLLEIGQRAIPSLVDMLQDDQSSDVARDILLRFEDQVIPFLVAGLNAQHTTAREQAKSIIVKQVNQKPECIFQVVQLLKPSLPKLARETLLDILVYDLTSSSLPALLKGLEDAVLVQSIAEALKRLAQTHQTLRSEILAGLGEALRKDKQQRGARHTLVELGAQAMPIVSELITDPDETVSQAAQGILREIGGPAFPFFWTAFNDTSKPERRAVVLTIFHSMPASKISSALIELLVSDKSQDITMGLGLLLERIRGEAVTLKTDQKIIPALLEYTQAHEDELIALRTIAWLLMVGGNMVVKHIVEALQDYPHHHERLIFTLLLLGREAEDKLLEILYQPTTQRNARLKAEVAGALGMRTTHQKVSDYALSLSTHGYGVTKSITNANELTIALRALGGLLAGGNWQISYLEDLRHHSIAGPEHELAETLLGKLIAPTLEKLHKDLKNEREARETDKDAFEKRVQELTEQVTQLKNSNHILQTSNHALQVSNDTLQASNQELQANQTILQARIRQLEWRLE